MIRSHEGEVTKPFENPITYHNERVDATKTPRPTKPSNLLSNLLFPLALQQCQLSPHHQGGVINPPERVAASVAYEVEVRHVPKGGGGNFEQDP